MTAMVVVMTSGACRPVLAEDKQAENPVNIEAQSLSRDDTTNTVTAAGDVEVVQGNRILHADEVKYNMDTNTVTAKGNVTLLDEAGNVHFSDEVQLTQDLKNGYVKSLLSILADGSRFTAKEATRTNGVRTMMRQATYTPCNVCETDPNPLWQIKADKVVHNEQDRSVEYKKARLEMFGVPVFYMPVLSHPDPTVTRKSGFLRPQYGYASDVGTSVQAGYYFGDISPDIDASLFVRPTTLRGTLVQGEWRQRFENGKLQLNGSTAKSDRHEEDGRVESNRWRGSIDAKGLFDLDDKWRAGFTAERVSDKEYLRLYDITSKNVLESEAYAERFDNRDYTRISAFNFQDVRLGLRPEQPDIIPSIEHRMYGDPGGLLGGRWTAGAGLLSLQRDGGGQDVQRLSMDAGWERRDISKLGFVTKTSLDIRGDSYMAQDKDAAIITPGSDAYTSAFRGLATGDITTSYPLVQRTANAQIMLEPQIGISYTPQVNNTENRIANEDSIDVQLDSNNLFATNRFPGIDRIEDGARINYGVGGGMYGDEGRYAKAFIGQSFRFNDDSSMPTGSGLDDNLSDIVGQVNLGLSQYVNADYRFQIDTDRFKPARHEVLGHAGNEDFKLNAGYIFLAPVEGTGFTETREQFLVSGDVYLNPRWWVNSMVLTDLGEEPGLRRAGLGLNYSDECFSFSLQGLRNLAVEATGDSGTSILMRIGFKNIGEFVTPGIQISQTSAP